MRDLAKLVADVAEAWRAQHHRASAFPSLAAEGLQRLKDLSLEDLLAQVMPEPSLPPQFTPSTALLLSQSSNLELDLDVVSQPEAELVCPRRPGASLLVAGDCVLAEYRFSPAASGDFALRSGSFTLSRIAPLAPGAVFFGGEDKHSLFALVHLSPVTVTLRLSARSRYEYGGVLAVHDPHLLQGGITPGEWLAREKQLLSMLTSLQGESLGAELLVQAMGKSDLGDALTLLVHCLPRLSEAQLTEALSRLRSVHGDAVDALSAVLAQRRRRNTFESRLRKVTQPTSQYLWALLLLVHDWASFFRGIQERFPGKPAAELVAAWLQENGHSGDRSQLLDTLNKVKDGNGAAAAALRESPLVGHL